MRAQRSTVQVLERDERDRKQCVGCLRWLPTDEYQPHRNVSDGLHSRCRDCKRLAKFGITYDEFYCLLSEQGGRCAVCRKPDPGPRRWNVDHDHSCCPAGRSCGRCVRGLLCHSCNVALGHLRDDISVLKSAIAYLEGPVPATTLSRMGAV